MSSRIAAGEVVERPAAVIKELVDNSLDAASTLITVTVEEGGRRLLQVTDNGDGMNAHDAQLACQRFATSKLHSESDLNHIHTFGFRGEALPSIASVSKFRLLTQAAGEVVGTELYAEGGVAWSCQEKPTPQGTQIEVKDLFFNTPGRLKFLKTIGTEFSKICLSIQQAALAHHQVHFRLIHNAHTVFDFPQVSSHTDRVRQIYGTKLLDRMLPINFEQTGLKIMGFAVSPYHTRSSRSPQEIFVNRRPIKNTTITHAAYEAYGSFLPKGQHPAFILFIDIPPATVDVNVHPTKREVRFSDAAVVHALVKTAIRQPLKNQTSSNIGIQQAERYVDSKSSFTQALPVHSYRSTEPDALIGETVASLFMPTTTHTPGNAGQAPESLTSQEPRALYPSTADEPHVVSLGQVNRTFLVVQVNNELQIVDQHTAHERVLFDRLWEAWHNRRIDTQPLLLPETIELPPHQCNLLAEHLPDLAKLGLEIDQFGERSFIIRAVPSIVGVLPYSAFINDVLEDLAEWKSQDSLDVKVRAVLASMACQSAVQAGRPMSEPEITVLINDWAHAGQPMTCPHGRRIALRFSTEELDKIFGRA